MRHPRIASLPPVDEDNRCTGCRESVGETGDCCCSGPDALCARCGARRAIHPLRNVCARFLLDQPAPPDTALRERNLDQHRRGLHSVYGAWPECPECLTLASTSTPPAPLNVERLARLLHDDPALCRKRSPSGHPRWMQRPLCVSVAERIAYAEATPEPTE